MKASAILLIITMITAGLVVSACAAGVLDLSTLGKKPSMEPVSLPRFTAYTLTIGPISNQSPIGIVDLSTLGKTKVTPIVNAIQLSAAKPIVVTPSFSIKNANITMGANTVFTPAIALRGAELNSLRPNVSVYTPPIAIYGGS